MSEPFLAEIRIFGFNFPPRGWAFCDGQILPINQNQSLYSLLGTTYGGDGRTTFALPDLRGRTPVHRGSGYQLGNRAGAETIALTTAQIPSHNHGARASSSANIDEPDGEMPGKGEFNIYREPASLVNMRSDSIANAGGGQAHNNMQPFTTLNFCIALRGLFPSRN